MNAPAFSNAFTIRGLTTSGARFRPSDWAERLAGAFSAFDLNHRMNYSPYVQPRKLDGVPCVVVDRRLRELDPPAWRFLVQFAASNELQSENGEDTPQNAPPTHLPEAQKNAA